MEIADWQMTAELNEVYRDVRKLGLEKSISELDAYGFTVIPPEEVGTPDFIQGLREEVLAVHERRTGQTIDDLTSGKTGTDGPLSAHFALLEESPVFRQALLNPTVYTMARYLCGNSVVLSDFIALLKNQDDTPTHMLHIDQHGTPPPLPPYAQVCNVTWALTDYTPENGPVAIVPGSHRFARRPLAYESNFLAPDAPVKAIPVEAAAGSLIVWHGATWHASYPRKAPGLRVNLIMVFTRAYMRQIRDFRRDTPPEIYQDNPELTKLLGIDIPYPFNDGEFPDVEHLKRYIATGENPWA